jgi:hypothetical protein
MTPMNVMYVVGMVAWTVVGIAGTPIAFATAGVYGLGAGLLYANRRKREQTKQLDSGK